tara:strand:- start:85 stop:1359 length:1275 start_codon:yes stop_codon:yes gene_type:complete
VDERDRLTNTNVKALEPRSSYYEVFDSEQPGFCVRVQPTGTKTYYVWYMLPSGKRRPFRIANTNATTAEEARKAAKKHWADATRGNDPQEQKNKPKEHTLQTFLTGVYTARATHKTAADTVTRIERNFKGLLNKPLGDIKPMWLESWKKTRKDNGAAASSINREIAALRGVLSRAIDWGFLEDHPLKRVKQLKLDSGGKPRYLEPKEEKRLYKALDAREETLRAQRDSHNRTRAIRHEEPYPDLRTVPYADFLKPMTLIAMNCGLRRGELFDLTWADCILDGQSPRITVQGGTAKSGNTRHVPLNATALDTLTKWKSQRGDSDLVFPSPITGKRFDNIKKTWVKLVKDADVEEFRFHDCRHHFASMLVQKEVDLNVVRELLGHASLTMTLRYAYLSPDNTANAVALLDAPTNVVPMAKTENSST